MWLDKPQPFHQTESPKQSVQRRIPGHKEQWYTGSPHHWPCFPKAQKDIVDVETVRLTAGVDYTSNEDDVSRR